MATQVEINGINFIPIKDAAKSVSYSKDYVARLAREQKIVASLIGRQWFVDLVSLQNFAETSQLEQTVRKQQLSLERKREQLVKQESNNVKNEVHQKVRAARFHAQLVSVFVLGFGLLAGVGIYTTSNIFETQVASVFGLSLSTPSHQEAEVAAVSPVDEFVYEIAEPQPTTFFNNVVEYPVFISEAETRDMSIGNSEGIFLLARDGEVKTVDEVKAIFSDDVNVEFSDDSTGVVVYTDSDGTKTEYSFVSVPVGKRTGTSTKETL